MVQVFVGPELEPFQISKDRLCAESPVLNAMLNGDFKEAHEQTIKFPEMSVAAFDVFGKWLTTKTLLPLSPQPDIQCQDVVDFMDDLLDLYLLSHMYLIDMLDIQCTERIGWAIRQAHEGRYLPIILSSETIFFIWEHSYTDSRIRPVILEGLATWFHGDETYPLPIREATLPYRDVYLKIDDMATAIVSKMYQKITIYDEWWRQNPDERFFHEWAKGQVKNTLAEFGMMVAVDATREEEERGEDEMIEKWQQTLRT